ncbi:hypothetical protein SFC65_19890 [Priestia filamentosa]|uniref:hypothetical protein n=1 Tax=Priestia filamentosa TaxID=1402861 RepID=UPI003981ED6F
MKLISNKHKQTFLGQHSSSDILKEISQKADSRIEDQNFLDFLQECKQVANSYSSKSANKNLVRG